MGQAKIRFKCGYEEEQKDSWEFSSTLRKRIYENHKKECKICYKK